MTRWALPFITVCVFWASACWSDSSFPDRYDPTIQQAAEQYLPGYDWRLWKAQLFQESRLDPSAVSPVGAQGVAQFMPATWQEVARELDLGHVSPLMARPAILAGAYYQGKQIAFWSAPRPAADRYSLAAASYNAGAGNILQAQRRCDGANRYRLVIKCLPSVTGHHARETTTYVRRIWGYWTQMVVGP